MTNLEFAQIWNESSSPLEASKITGQTKQGCSCKASKLRKLGLDLKAFPAAKPITPLMVRFWSKVKKTDYCWVWTGSKHPKGYGQIQPGRRGQVPLFAHRLSWKIHFGELPETTMVLHRCDNPACVNPDHLFLGTAKDNTHDMMAKGRGWWQNGDIQAAQ